MRFSQPAVCLMYLLNGRNQTEKELSFTLYFSPKLSGTVCDVARSGQKW